MVFCTIQPSTWIFQSLAFWWSWGQRGLWGANGMWTHMVAWIWTEISFRSSSTPPCENATSGFLFDFESSDKIGDGCIWVCTIQQHFWGSHGSSKAWITILCQTLPDNKIIEDIHGYIRTEAKSNNSEKLTCENIQSIVRNCNVLEQRGVNHPSSISEETFLKEWATTKLAEKDDHVRKNHLQLNRMRCTNIGIMSWGKKLGATHWLKRHWNEEQLNGNGFCLVVTNFRLLLKFLFSMDISANLAYHMKFFDTILKMRRRRMKNKKMVVRGAKDLGNIDAAIGSIWIWFSSVFFPRTERHCWVEILVQTFLLDSVPTEVVAFQGKFVCHPTRSEMPLPCFYLRSASFFGNFKTRFFILINFSLQPSPCLFRLVKSFHINYLSQAVEDGRET